MHRRVLCVLLKNYFHSIVPINISPGEWNCLYQYSITTKYYRTCSSNKYCKNIQTIYNHFLRRVTMLCNVLYIQFLIITSTVFLTFPFDFSYNILPFEFYMFMYKNTRFLAFILYESTTKWRTYDI